MTQQSEIETVKVYELAKELGMDSIALLDKLKALNIQVKSHMSDLRREAVRGLLPALRKKDGGIATEVGVKKGVSKAVKRKSSAPETAPSSVLVGTLDKKSSAPVIRRRVAKSLVGVEEPTELLDISVAATASPSSFVEKSSLEMVETSSVLEEQGHLDGTELFADVPSARSVPASEGGGSSFSPEAVVETASSLEETHSERMQEPLVTGLSSSSPVDVSASTFPSAEIPTGEVKKKLPIVLTPRPVAPKRNILKIVEAAPPPQRPIIKPTAPHLGVSQATSLKNTSSVSGDPEGFRIIKMTKENLDQMVEEEAAKKRGGLRDPEIRPEDVRFADYRKKELVFLPKKKKIPLGKEIRKTQLTVSKAQKRVISFSGSMTVQELANQLSVKAGELIRKLMQMGEMVTLNQSLDFDTASLIATEYQYELKNTAFDEKKILGEEQVDSLEELQSRPPIVTIMGHVDHGKTTLLDAIREANVVAQEAGGITQHIGAYTIEKNGKKITFIDTPGHEAFTVMRARGAQVTDLVILVVSADDGVMPQTKEALSHAQAAKVPVLVAINKIDKPGANPERVKQALSELNLVPEEWGGETQFIPISALKRLHLDQLLDAVLLQAEMLDLKSNPNASFASGTVLEARLEKGKGPMVSVLVSRGTLRLGDAWVVGSLAGKVRALSDHHGKSMAGVPPGFAAEVLGLEGVPQAGEIFQTVSSESEAREIAENRIQRGRVQPQGGVPRVSLEDLFSKVQAGSLKELHLILKADTFGSVEAIRESLEKLSTPLVKVRILLAAVGGITESDILLAKASQAIILGFHVRPETKARQLAEKEKIEIQCYTIIYELLDQIKLAMVGLLDKKKVEKFLGRAEVRQVFTIPKLGIIAGCSVIDGKILRHSHVRLLRDSRMIFDGKLGSLKRFKDDIKEVATGFECGISIENYHDLKPQDVIEAYEVEWITPELS